MKYIEENFQTREEWLRARRESIGGSDASAILGLSRFVSPFALWARKTGKIEDEPETLVMKVGHALEPVMAAELSDMGYEVTDPGLSLYRSVERPWMHYSADRTIGLRETQGLIELKKDLSGIGWDEEASPAALAQVNWGLLVTGLPKAVIAAIVGFGQKLRVYPGEGEFLGPELDLQAVMLEHIELFRARYILTDTPPPADFSESTRKALSALYPQDTGAEIELPPEDWRETLAAMTLAQERIKANKAIEDEAKNKLRAALGDASLARIPGVGRVTWKTINKKAYEVKATSYRDLRVYLDKEKP